MTGESRTYKRKIEYLDLEDFDIKEKRVEYTFAPASDYQEAVERLGGDEKKLLRAVNAQLKIEAAQEAMKNEGVSDNLKTVNKIIRPFRNLQPWKSMSKDEQDKALFEMLKSNSALVQTIRDNAENEDDENEEEE